MQYDPLSDAFTRIFNAEQAGHYEVSVETSKQTTRTDVANNAEVWIRTESSRESKTEEQDHSELNS